MRHFPIGPCREAWGRFQARPLLRVRTYAVVVLALSALFLFRGLRQGGALGGNRSNDFAAYHTAARGVLRGELESSYRAARPYQYPPTLAVLLAPLGLLPARAASILWTAGNLALLLWTLRLSREALGPPVAGLDQVLGLLLIARAAESDFANGNANTLVLFFLILGLAVARRGSGAAGGSLLALAGLLKLAPLLLLPWILWRRRWNLALGFLIGLVLWGGVLPALVLGPLPFARAWKAFYQETLRPLAAGGEPSRGAASVRYEPGQSLHALLHRLLSPTDATAHDEAVVKVNVADLSGRAVDVVYLAGSAVVLAALCFRFRGKAREWEAAEVGAVLSAMVLLSPLSRKAHFVALFPAGAAGSAAIRESCPGRRGTGLTLWIAAFALVDLTAPALVGRQAASWILAFCPFGLAAGLLLALSTLRPAQPPAAGRPPPAISEPPADPLTPPQS
jgi:hypothetical protein